jgi:hypothetical protein
MITPGQLRAKADKRTIRRMYRHFFTGAFDWKLILTPICSKRAHWCFEGYETIIYLDIFIFGIRVIRWQI